MLRENEVNFISALRVERKNSRGGEAMKKINVFEKNSFNDFHMSRFLVHESESFKILSFNFKGGQELPIHSHDLDGQLSISVLEGSGEFLAKEHTMPAQPGDILVSDIREPHGLRAITDMRVLVTIAPPI